MQVHGGADAGKTLFHCQQSSDRAVHTAAHGDQSTHQSTSFGFCFILSQSNADCNVWGEYCKELHKITKYSIKRYKLLKY
jgi:hypothetical protein